MATFSFTIPGAPPGTASTIEVKGPAGLTQEQARQIFEKQLDVGAFAGIKPGAVISAATQAAQGLSAATSQLGQALSGRVGALGGGIAGAVGQVGALASGALASATSTVKGLASSVATAASSTALSGEINIANFAKSIPAVGPIANMTSSDVTSALATAKNLAGQAVSTLTNTGAGSFALNASQLESAGVLKPGMSALVAAGSSLSSVLKSPAAFTGKDGITNIGSLLGSPAAQNNIQQTLMNNGLQQVTKLAGELGSVPASLTAGLSLASASLAGNAGAISDLAKGALGSLPNPSQILSQLKNAQFGVNLANAKIPDSFKALEVPSAVVDSVNRLGINAATTRVLGSAKIPVPDFAPSPSSVAAAVSSAVSSLGGALGSLPTLSSIPALSGALSSLSGVPNPAALASAAVSQATAAAQDAFGSVTGAAGRLLG